MDTEGDRISTEHGLLREFWDAWVFFHRIRNEPAESEKWQESRLKLSAQGLADAAEKVRVCIAKRALETPLATH